MTTPTDEAVQKALADERAFERRRIARRLREVAEEQSSWLWFELGETALLKVADFIERS